MNIHLRIKEIVEFKNITQDVIGTALGVTGKTAHNYLNGHTKISVEQIPIIAKALRVQIDQLFQEVGTPLNTSSKPEVNMRVAEEPGACPNCTKLQADIDKWKDKYIYLLENGVPKKENGDARCASLG